MKTKQEFISHYNQLIKNDDELKEKQEKAKKQGSGAKFYLLLLILIPVYIFVIAASQRSLGSSAFALIPFFIILTVFFAALLTALLSIRKSRLVSYFEGKYKDELINFLLEGKNFSFQQNKTIYQKDFKASRLYGGYSRYKGEDLLTIKLPSDHGEMIVSMSDLNVESTSTDSNGNTKTSTVFKGVFGFVEFEKNFNFNLAINRILPKNEIVKLESAEFNKRFRIYCTDQIIARLIFTPDRMQKMLKIKNRIRVNIKGNRLYFGVHSEKLFETTLCSERAQIKIDDFYNDISAFNLFIEQVKSAMDDVS